MRKQTSKRRWKARIRLGQWIPDYVITIFPDLIERAIVVQRDYGSCYSILTLSRS